MLSTQYNVVYATMIRNTWTDRFKIFNILFCSLWHFAGALKESLSINPYIRGSKPEPHFFDKEDADHYLGGYDAYLKKLPGSLPGQIVVDKTPRYMRHPDVPERVHKMNPDIKLLAILCDPVAHKKRAKKYWPEQNHTLDEMLMTRDGKINLTWQAVWTGYYDEQLLNWHRFFKPEQLLLIDSSQLKQNPVPVLNQVERFLNIPVLISDKYFVEESGLHCLNLHGKVNCVHRATSGKPVLSDNHRKLLYELYNPHYQKLLNLTNIKFQWPNFK